MTFLIRNLCGIVAITTMGMPAMAQPTVDLTDLAWLEGSWEGPGLDGAPAVEVYSRSAGGQMIGHFRQLKPDGSIMFYELITIGKQNGTLTYALKHFNPDLTGWEERDMVRRFPLSSATGKQWEFSGIVYERTGPDSMAVTVAVDNEGGAKDKLVFQFQRKRPVKAEQ
jgi:Domain of unknown function (DUF6265)